MHDPSPGPAPELLTNALRVGSSQTCDAQAPNIPLPLQGRGATKPAPRAYAIQIAGCCPSPRAGERDVRHLRVAVPSIDCTHRKAGRRPGAGPGEGLCLEPKLTTVIPDAGSTPRAPPH